MITDRPIRIEEHVGSAGAHDGAVVVFAGVVRPDRHGGRRVARIHYECYHEMAERELDGLVEEVRLATGVSAIRAVHRVGDVPAGEVSLLVVVAATHRGEAYDASRRVVEEIKRRLPVWKKEFYDDGTDRWL